MATAVLPQWVYAGVEMKLLLRWLITSIALVVAAWLVPGIHVDNDSWKIFALMALILGLVNAFIRPVLKFLSCPVIILTLGFFILVINGFTLWMAPGIAERLGIGFRVDSFGSAFLGALIVSIVSVTLNALVQDESPRAR